MAGHANAGLAMLDEKTDEMTKISKESQLGNQLQGKLHEHCSTSSIIGDIDNQGTNGYCSNAHLFTLASAKTRGCQTTPYNPISSRLQSTVESEEDAQVDGGRLWHV